MSSTIFFFLFIPLLAFILLTINLVFAPHNPYQEKDSAFECGFSSFLGQNRTQFSISFFIFALLFLLFDLEILLVYPYLVSAYTNGIYGLAVMLIFLLALTLGFAFELGKKALSIDSRQMSNTSKVIVDKATGPIANKITLVKTDSKNYSTYSRILNTTLLFKVIKLLEIKSIINLFLFAIKFPCDFLYNSFFIFVKNYIYKICLSIPLIAFLIDIHDKRGLFTTMSVLGLYVYQGFTYENSLIVLHLYCLYFYGIVFINYPLFFTLLITTTAVISLLISIFYLTRATLISPNSPTSKSDLVFSAL